MHIYVRQDVSARVDSLPFPGAPESKEGIHERGFRVRIYSVSPDYRCLKMHLV